MASNKQLVLPHGNFTLTVFITTLEWDLGSELFYMEPGLVISNNVAFLQVKPQMNLCSLLLSLEKVNSLTLIEYSSD